MNLEADVIADASRPRPNGSNGELLTRAILPEMICTTVFGKGTEINKGMGTQSGIKGTAHKLENIIQSGRCSTKIGLQKNLTTIRFDRPNRGTIL